MKHEEEISQTRHKIYFDIILLANFLLREY